MCDIAALEAINPRAMRDCCGRFATGVTVITTRTPEGDHGMAVSAFMSVSLDPPLICISVGNLSKMLPKVRESGRYAVNILSEGMRDHALHFAGRPNEALRDLFREQHGLPVLREAAAVLVADLVQQVETGDHVLLVGHVRYLDCDPAAKPLVYHAGRFGGLENFPL